ncbi:MAG: lysozyme family protein [Bacilli bacterium]|nr:lysozyme family protein [Bacilli bacterium]
MKQYFYFFFDQGGSLCCINEYMFQEHRLKKDKAIKALDLANSFNIKKIILKDNSMNLISNHNMIIINDVDTFYHKRYFDFLPKVMATINNSFRYNLLKDSYQDGIRVDNMTFYTGHYKKKMALKSGNLALFSGIAILSSTVFFQNVSRIDREINNSMESINLDAIINARNNTDIVIDKTRKYLEVVEAEKQARLEEEKRRDYKNFTSYTDETKYAYDNYFDLVYEEATRWGLDPNLVMAILIQESKGKRENLMQISYSSWINHSFECYDFIDNEYKKVVLNDLNTPKGNIRAGCMILRYSIERNNNNIMLGAQNYNMGDGNMDVILNATCAGENKTKDELFTNQNDMSFVNYTKYAKGGDKHYIANISQFLNQTDNIFFLDVDDKGNIIKYNHNLKEKDKVLTK